MLGFSSRHHPLALSLVATYGRTLCKAAEDHALQHPNTIDLLAEDCACFTVSSVAVGVSGIVALLFGLLASRKEAKAASPLFLLLVYILAYGGFSLVLHVYRAAIYGIIVAFDLAPDRLMKENQLIFLRLLRSSETALR